MKKTRGITLTLASIIALFCTAPQTVLAAESEKQINGQVYILDAENGNFDYEGKKSEGSSSDNTYGTLFIKGSVEENGKKDGIIAFNATGQDDASTDNKDESEIAFIYQYDSTLLEADDSKDWSLYQDKSKKIGNLILDEKVEKGAIVVQSSFDGKTWSTDFINTNVFESNPENKDGVLYSTSENQLVNGCFYKVIVAYQTRRQRDNKKLFAQYNYQEHVEVYEFYICNEAESVLAAKPTDKPIYYFKSDPVNTRVDNGYSEKNVIETDDVQNGWNLGQFYINGFSGNAHFYDGDEIKKANPVFLKNLGDKLTLWFRLDQTDLDALNNNEYLSINPDEKGSDQGFHVSPQNFKRGALIVKFTDYEQQSHINVYTDYLSAAATTTADTKVQLFEEGDYEVALDYEIKDQSPLAWKIPKPAKLSAYRIYFKFSVRNSNCMVYPMDVKTGAELRVPYTENGFKLDLARSRYLDLSVKKKVLTDDGLDLRVSQISSDQEEYTDEGIYEFTVSNEITKDRVTKVIYVGPDNLMKAYVKYGKDYGGNYSIADLKKMHGEGYQFEDDGSIQAPLKQVQQELDNSEAAVIAETTEVENSATDSTSPTIEIQGNDDADNNTDASNSSGGNPELQNIDAGASPKSEAKENDIESTSHSSAIWIVIILIAVIAVVLIKQGKVGKKTEKGKDGHNV